MYGDPGLRPLGDVDLLVKPRDKDGFKQLLLKDGFRIPVPVYPDLLEKDAITIDLHTHLLNVERIRTRRFLFPGDLSPMWKRATPFFAGQGGLLRLDPTDNFVALSAHALKHSYSRQIWLADLNESLQGCISDSCEWEKLMERIYFWRQERVVLYALLLVEGMFGLKVPQSVKDYLRVSRLNALEKHLIRLMLEGFSSAHLCNILWPFNIKGLGNQLMFAKETIFPRGEIMTQIFPHNSSTKAIYVKRTLSGITSVCESFLRALSFSLKSGRKGR
jgi:hypothetical protein